MCKLFCPKRGEIISPSLKEFKTMISLLLKVVIMSLIPVDQSTLHRQKLCNHKRTSQLKPWSLISSSQYWELIHIHTLGTALKQQLHRFLPPYVWKVDFSKYSMVYVINSTTKKLMCSTISFPHYIIYLIMGN